MKKWEYLMRRELSEDQLNELGREGWELVVAVQETDYSILFLLKRPLPSPSRGVD